jgi:hypothetical protein
MVQRPKKSRNLAIEREVTDMISVWTASPIYANSPVTGVLVMSVLAVTAALV